MHHNAWDQVDGWIFWRFKHASIHKIHEVFNGWKIFLLRIFIRVINAMKITNIKNNLMNDVIIIRYM